MSVFCKHKWEKVSEIVRASGMEQFRESGVAPDCANVKWLTKPYIVIVQCEKCGKIKQFKGVL